LSFEENVSPSKTDKTKPAPTAVSTDAEIWTAILDGSASAWELLVRRYETLIYTIATRAGLSMSDAGDCFQQTWYQLYTHRTSVTQPDRLSAWLTTAAKREALRLRRRADKSVDSDALVYLADSNPLADEELAALEQRQKLESALERLDSRCAALLTALFLDPDSPSYDSIAADLGIPRNSIGPVRSRCLTKIRSILEAEGWI
jgi:RNA polymerase sigma factor (sigma-70 family)